MSQYGQKVVAVIDTQSAFGVTIRTLKDNVDTLTGQMTTLLADAPETLDTLNEIAAAISDDPAFFTSMSTANTTLQANIDALQVAASNARDALQTLLQGGIDLRAPIAEPAFTGQHITHTAGDLLPTTHSIVGGFPDLILKTNQGDFATHQNEGRVLWQDAGGGAHGAIKMKQSAGQSMDFYVDGITAGDKVLSLESNVVEALGNFSVAKSFPDVELKSGDEKRILFSDAGGGSTAAIKHVNSSLDFYAGGIASGNKEMSIDTDGVDVSALKIDGTAVTATATEINALDGRLDVLEADPTTKTYVDQQVTNLVDAAPGALDTLNELAAALGDDANFSTSVTNSLALKANLSGASFTGNLSVAKSYPDIELKANDEKRILFSDAGGAASAGIKHVSGSLDFYVGGIGGSNKEMSLDTDGLDVTALKIDGTAVSATAAELNYTGDLGTFSGSTIADNQNVKVALQSLETAVEGAAAADAELTELATMSSGTASALADLTQTEVEILDGATLTTTELNYVDGVTSAIQTQLNAIQADVDQNETDADNAISNLSTNLNNEGAARLLADNANETHIDNLATLSGVAKDEQHLSTFSGSTISDDQTVKQALQALETAVETKQATDAELTELATMASTTAAALADLTEAEVQILDGATVTTAELNILDGVTSTAAELNILDGVTSTATELNLLDGVTATTAELNYVDGVTSNVQTQLDAKAALAGATFAGDVTQTPSASVTPASNGQLMVEATNNTTITFKLKGSDGTVRSGTITLS